MTVTAPRPFRREGPHAQRLSAPSTQAHPRVGPPTCPSYDAGSRPHRTKPPGMVGRRQKATPEPLSLPYERFLRFWVRGVQARHSRVHLDDSAPSLSRRSPARLTHVSCVQRKALSVTSSRPWGSLKRPTLVGGSGLQLSSVPSGFGDPVTFHTGLGLGFGFEVGSRPPGAAPSTPIPP